MSTPQDSRARRRQKARRARKNDAWLAKRAEENAQDAKPKTPAKKAS